MILFVGMLIEFMAIKACLSSASSTWPAAVRSASGLLSRVAAFLMSQAGAAPVHEGAHSLPPASASRRSGWRAT
jgi:hypothetical protein